ncbi:MAG: Dabb family protein [Bacilli bacterium]|nr:Dabb family protein [Bacilli bacterium]
MVKHIVCFKIKEECKNRIEEAKNTLLSMVGNVPMLRKIVVGVDFLHSERSYDIILETWFDSVEDLNDYQNDPYHCSVVKKLMHEIREASVAIDYFEE